MEVEEGMSIEVGRKRRGCGYLFSDVCYIVFIHLDIANNIYRNGSSLPPRFPGLPQSLRGCMHFHSRTTTRLCARLRHSPTAGSGLPRDDLLNKATH